MPQVVQRALREEKLSETHAHANTCTLTPCAHTLTHHCKPSPRVPPAGIMMDGERVQPLTHLCSDVLLCELSSHGNEYACIDDVHKLNTENINCQLHSVNDTNITLCYISH